MPQNPDAGPRIRRALISVYDKTGIVDFARALHVEFGIEIISTGGTAKTLSEANIPVTLIEDLTGFPELLDGRVKTLHPHIHAAILADRDNPDHMRQLAERGIQPIDMVVVNLYPFEKTVADPNCTFEQAIEMIDIGGVALLRAAAKNHKHVLVPTLPGDQEGLLDWLRDSNCTGVGSAQFRRDCAASTLMLVSTYDAAITQWLFECSGETPAHRNLHLGIMRSLKYGENPHQSAESMREVPRAHNLDLTIADRLSENALGNSATMSFNNYLDADAALTLCAELSRTARGPHPLWHRFPTGVCGTGFLTGAPRTGAQPVPPAARQRKSGSTGVGGSITEETWTERNLPHLQVPEATYFVTFCLRTGALTEPERDIVLSACRFWHGRKLTLHAVVVMPDHVHLLLTPHEVQPRVWVPLGELSHSIKRFSSLEINKLRGAQGPLWMDESFDRVVRDEKEFVEKWEYIEANPVTAGIAQPGQYRWYWTSRTEFQETVVGREEDRLETGPTKHRLETGATSTESGADQLTRSCTFIKHTNPCGVGISPNPLEAYTRAYLGDPNAAMGGILACDFPIDAEFAAAVMETYDRIGKPLRDAGAAHAPGGFFLEVWLAPTFDDDAVAIIRGTHPDGPKKKWGETVRLLAVGDMTAPPDPSERLYRSIAGGMLVQTPDLPGLNEDQWRVVTTREPTDDEMADLRLAWLICKHTKSNAISLVKNGMLLGNGAGQMSRVMSCRIATWLAKENGHLDDISLQSAAQSRVDGPVAASDAFFPFRDGPDLLIDAGVTALIQPGGSKRDEDTIAACNERGVAMIFTGTRHFRH